MLEKKTAEKPKPEAREASSGRRPIPLPPASLRPPPRVRRSASDLGAEGTVPVTEATSAGARWGFVLGLALPFLGLIIALGIWWSGGANEIESSSPVDPQVRARVERAPEAGGGTESAVTDLGGLPPSADLVAIQVASFRTRTKAERVLAQAKERTGLAGMVLPAEVDGVKWHRIILGAFLTQEDAIQAAEPLLREGMITEVLVWPIPSRWVSVLTGQEAS